MATRGIVPRANGEGSIGTEKKHWGGGFFDKLSVKALDVIGGNAAAFGGIVAASLEWNGYVMFAGGFTIQWGIQEVTPNAVTEITFPVSFARGCVSFAGTPSNERRTKGIVEVEAAMITSWNAKAKIPVKVWTDAEKVWLVWIAVGF